MQQLSVPLGAMDCPVKPGNDDGTKAGSRYFFIGPPGLSMGLGTWG